MNLSLESLYHKDGWLITRYHPGSVYEGTEGELYRMTEDPLQMENRWDDPSLGISEIRLTCRTQSSAYPHARTQAP